MNKSAILLPMLALSCAASMAAATTAATTTTTTHKSRLVYTGPTVVTIHTHPKKRHAHRTPAAQPVHHATAPNTRQVGGPPAPGTTVTTTTTVHKRTSGY
ncbi:hypothetical protein GCM10028796_21790 [Ramlibacter monticola]|uniref:Uncharacterized protein n=1 Tax=Ramlibacter monticola TaxID=1926872 RepID=A0A937CTD3_9BURK|nr:hypothetical protein [Ramlibacter monticola]MBL0392430.1 hypothetical protein [Ramlibacter monticola]